MKRVARQTIAGTGPLWDRQGAQGQGLAGRCGALPFRWSALSGMQHGGLQAVRWAVWVMGRIHLQEGWAVRSEPAPFVPGSLRPAQGVRRRRVGYVVVQQRNGLAPQSR